MGVHKNIRDLNPLALYTFDRTEAYVEIETNTGYCANRTEYDFPPLMIKNSGLFYKGYDLKVIQPALSEIEQNTKYQSFSTGIPQYITLGYTNAKAKAFQYTLNNGSVYADADLTDQMDMILSGTSYTVSFQFSAAAHTNPADVPMHRIVEEIASTSYMGSYSYANISGVDNKLLSSPVSLYNGYFLEETNNNNIDSINGFGFRSTFDLTYTLAIDKTVGPLPYPYPMYYQETYNTNKIVLVFKFRNIKLYAQAMSSDNESVALYIYQNNNNDSYYPLIYTTSNEIYSLFFVVTNTNIKIYINNNSPISLGIQPENQFDNTLHVGIKSEWQLSNKIDKALNLPLYESVAPLFNMKIDNLAIYNREIDRAELLNIFYSNYNYISIFKQFGYYQLYDFSTLYDSKATRYIENQTVIPDVISNSSYLISQSNESALPYVIKNKANDYEYVFKCTKKSSLQTNNHYYPVSMISGEGTLSFLFKTADLHGILFANTLYEYNINNVILLMSYGYLEIWVANTLVARISDMSNNEWHEVFITFGAETNFYIDKVLYYKHNISLVNTTAITLFGNGLPGNNDLECDFALIGVSSQILNPFDMDIFTQSAKIAYSAYGQITLNNIAVGTNIFIYNRYSGVLIEKIKSDSADGTFSYTNRYPYTISVIVTDSTLLSGKSYIVDPVEIE